MRPVRFGAGIVVAAVLLAGVMSAASPARAQSDGELNALNSEVQELRKAARYREALAVAERYVAAAKREHGEEHSEYGIAITWMARLLQDTNRWAEAEPLMRRALAIAEKSHGPEHHEVAAMLSNLADLLRNTNRHGEAEPLIRRALAIDEKASGPEHLHVGIRLNDLALVLQATNRLPEAESALRRSLAIQEKTLGPDHAEVAIVLSNLAILLQTTNRLVEAEPLMRRALAIDEKTFGSEHPNVGFRLNVLATLLMPERLAEAESLLRRALAINEKSWGPEHTAVASKRLLAAVGTADAKATEAIRTAIAGLDASLEAIDKRLAAQFPEYASLANPRPLAIVAVQALLKPDEALIVFLDVRRFGPVPGETLAWAVTKTKARWISIPLETDALAERVAKLRCGLDRQGQWEWAGRAGRWLAKGERCRALQPEGLGPDEPLPFELAAAHELYQDLLAPFADLTQGKSLIIVPSGPLTSLPFHVLVGVRPAGSDTLAPPAKSEAATAKGGANASNPEGLTPYRNAAWLALKQAITVLPSVGTRRRKWCDEPRSCSLTELLAHESQRGPYDRIVAG
jgi:tetratricopeptide (TPR) repeat protein